MEYSYYFYWSMLRWIDSWLARDSISVADFDLISIVCIPISLHSCIGLAGQPSSLILQLAVPISLYILLAPYSHTGLLDIFFYL